MDYPYYTFQLRTVGPSCGFSDMPPGISFDGSSEYSVTAWIYLKDYAGVKEVISQGNGFIFGVDGRQLLVELNGNVAAASKNAVTGEAWHYIAVVFDKTAFRFYCDGEFLTAVSWSGEAVPVSGSLVVGRNLNGYVRNAALYSHALSLDDVKNGMFSIQNANAYYDFTSNPAVEHVNHLKIQYDGLAEIVKTGTAAIFQDQGYLKITGGGNPGGNAGEPYTIQAWIYLDAAASTGCCTILHNTNIGNDTGVLFTAERELNAKGDAEFYLCLRHGMFTYESNFLKSALPVPQKTWTNVAAVFEKDTCRIYMDNRLLLEKSGVLPIPSDLDDPICYIGSKVNGGTENGIDVFEGAIARLDIWDKALSPKELLQFTEKLPDTASDGNHPRAAFFFQDSFVNLTDFIPAGRRRGIYIGMTDAEAAQEGEHERETDDSPNPYGDMEIPSQLRALAIREYLEQSGEVSPDTEHFFAVNHFERDGKVYFVIHLTEGSYIVSDMVKDDDPDLEYILWMIELIIIVVGGICSILFGLHPNTGQAVVNYIRQNIVNIPSLRAIFMGAAKAAVAAKCVEFLLELHHQNVLRSLLRVMFSVSFFTLMRVGITLIARALGGLAGLAVEIAALAVSVAVHLAKYPSAPVALEEILFHENTNTVGSVMCSDDDLSELDGAEWRAQKKLAYPLLYCLPDIYDHSAVKKITVQIKLNLQSSHAGKVFIRAVDRTVGGESLGNSDEASVILNGYKQETHFLLVEFPSHTIKTAANSFKLSLEWQAKLEGSGSWTRFAISENTVYVAFQRPKTPWNGGSAPCISFLELSYPWVAGAKTDEEAAGRVTSMINSMHDTFIYDTINGGPRYGITRLFDFRLLLEDLRKSGSGSYPVKINCYDCARMVEIFSNLWGCSLGVKIMVGKNGSGFMLNKVIAIGTGYWEIPFQGGFSFHAVAVNLKGKTVHPSNRDFLVYDACLEYDNRKTPWDNVPDSQRAAFLPVNVPFSVISGYPAVPMTEAPDSSYREHLAANNEYGAAECTMEEYAYDPRLKFSAGEQITVPPEARDRYRYDKWASGKSAFYKPDSMIQFEDYALTESRAYLRIAGSYHNSYVHKDIPTNSIELIVVPCRDQSMAHEIMLQRLSCLSSNDLKRTEPDGVFSEASVLFTSQNKSGTVKMTCIGNLFLTVVTGGQVNEELVCRALNRYIKTAGG